MILRSRRPAGMRNTVLLLVLTLLSAWHGLAAAFYEGDTGVQSLTPSNFDSTLTLGGGVTAVEFYAPWCGHCKTLTPEWKKAAKALKGIVGVAAVDADAHKELGGRFDVQGYPTIKLFHVNGGKLVSSDYNGGRTAAEIIKGALAEASKVALGRIGAKAGGGGGGGRASGGGGQGGCGAGGGGGGGGGGGQDLYGADTDIVKLTDADFHEQVTNSEDQWMVEFYAPWCGHCKNLVPHYDKFATAVQGKVKVGAVDCTQQEQTCQEFGVQGYPTIKWFGENKHSPVDFDGGRDESSLTAYALERWQMALPPPEVKQLTDQEGFVDNCVGAPADAAMELAAVPARQLCFLLFAPDILDSQAAGRNKYLDVLKTLAETHKTRPFSYLWVEAGAQPKLEAAVGVGGYGYPALVALSPSKLKYAALRSAYELDAVKTFVNHVRQGAERVQPVHGDALPALHTTEPWDGKDGQAPEEDEFDLADLMKEEL